MIDNMSITNECDGEGEIGRLMIFESFDIDFHDANETIMSRKKIADTYDTSLKQKGQNFIREEDIVLCRSLINLSEVSIQGKEKTGNILERCA